MENDYYKRYEPFFGSWYIKRFIGAGSYGKVFEIERRDEFDTVFTGALKVITVPTSQSELEEILSDGMDANGASTYFRDYVKNLNREIALMSKLKGHSNIVSYEDHQIYAHPDGIGWDILIRMELLTPITNYLKENRSFSQREVVKLGIDMCRALEICKRYDIIHRDIKPANIFISETEDYKLGDFGVARVASTASGASTRVGTVNYMAPEIFRGKKYTNSVDIYSLGLVMYQLLNANRMPFYPPYPQPITPASREYAQTQRLYGARLPAPVNASGRLAEIVLKACEPDPANRYSDPAQMRQDLEAIFHSVSTANFVMTSAAAAAPSEKTMPMRQQSDDEVTVKFVDPAQKRQQEEAAHRAAEERARAQAAQKKTQEEAARKAEAERRAAEKRAAEQARAAAAAKKTEAHAEQEHQTPAARPVPVKKAGAGVPIILGAAAAVVVILGGVVFAMTRSTSGSVPVSADPVSSSVAASVESVPASSAASEEASHSASSEEAAASSTPEENAAASVSSESVAVSSKPTSSSAVSSSKPASSSAPAASSSKPASSTAPSASSSKPTASSSKPAASSTAPAAAAPAAPAGAVDSGSCGANATWSLDHNGILTISGSGNMESSPWRSSHKTAIRTVNIQNGITSVCSDAFNGCTALSSVSLPGSLRIISSSAFYGCTSLGSVSIPGSVTALGKRVFYGCSALGSVSVPGSVGAIASETFYGCSSLGSVTIGEGVSSIGSSAFYGCKRLSSVSIPHSVKSIGSMAFSSCALSSVTIAGDCSYTDSLAGGSFDSTVTVNRS